MLSRPLPAPVRAIGAELETRSAPPAAARPPRSRALIHLGLFITTAATTTWVGSYHYAAFMADFTADVPPFSFWHGLWYSIPVLAILGTHEMGHYLACRRYGVTATLPYFIPAPPVILTGTLGALIRIRQRVPSKRVLFDIAAAGPIAGFLVTLLALIVGLLLSRVVPLPDDFVGYSLGEPLLFQGAAWLVWGNPPDTTALNLHPVGFAAWIGLLLTAINLLPIAQLDGGHISYAALGPRSTFVTLATTALVVILALGVSRSWSAWAILTIVMVAASRGRHPRTDDEHVPLDRRRRWVAVGTAMIFVASVTPVPIEVLSLIDTPS